MNGDAAFAIFSDSGDPQFMAYISASDVKSAIVGLKVATGLACINWIAFAATFVMISMCCRSCAAPESDIVVEYADKFS